MSKLAGLAILVSGVLLLVWGLDASDSLASTLSRFFSGAPTDRAVRLTLGGLACLVLGAGVLARPAKPSK